MCVKAIRLDKAEELHHKVLFAMFDEDKRRARVNFAEIATRLGVSDEVVRYNVKKLLKLGYIRAQDNEYELSSEKVILLNKKT